jgi:hypothetical protein
MKHILDEYQDQIISIFRNTSNRYESHLKAHPILTRMAKDDEVIFEAMRRAMLKEKFFFPIKGCAGPDFGITLFDLAPEVFLFASTFGPNQEGRTDVSFSTMHHHDDFLLSTINAKGKGYSSLIWKKGYHINHETKEVEIELDKFAPHPHMNIEFIDSHTAHTIFFPKELTMTYALWSTAYPTNEVNKIKSNPFIQKNKEVIKKVLNFAKIKPTQVGVTQYREDYFVPENGKIKFLPGQVHPQDDENIIQNKLHILQQFLKFDDIAFLKNKVYSNIKNADKDKVSQWLEKMIERDPIPRNYEGVNQYIPQRNVHLDEYKKCYSI